MTEAETRQEHRDSLLLIAQLRVIGVDETYRVKVRNLSAGGMMAEADCQAMRGSLVSVELRNLGWVDGSVAWVQGNRFGIAFVQEIDPMRARAPLSQDDEPASPRYIPKPKPSATGRLHKV